MIVISYAKHRKTPFRIIQNDTTTAPHVGGSVPLEQKSSDKMIFQNPLNRGRSSLACGASSFCCLSGLPDNINLISSLTWL
jgi:hypothetical protein